MTKHTTLNKIISERINNDLPVDFTTDREFTDPTIKLTELDGEAMRRFIIERKLVDKYFSWKIKQDIKFFKSANKHDNVTIYVNEQFLDGINQLLQNVFQSDYPKFKTLLNQKIGSSNLIFNLPFRLASLVDLFHKLHTHQFIAFPDLKTLSNWISKHFRYFGNDKYIQILESKAYEIMTENARKTKYPVIEIINNQIVFVTEKEAKRNKIKISGGKT